MQSQLDHTTLKRKALVSNHMPDFHKPYQLLRNRKLVTELQTCRRHVRAFQLSLKRQLLLVVRFLSGDRAHYRTNKSVSALARGVQPSIKRTLSTRSISLTRMSSHKLTKCYMMVLRTHLKLKPKKYKEKIMSTIRLRTTSQTKF